MADFVIPKGKEFSFTIKVIEKDSFLAQDLTNMDTASLEIFGVEASCSMFTTALTVTDALNGLLEGTIPDTDTATLDVLRGPKEDNYYLKPGYQGTIVVTFTDATLPISVLIEDVYVYPSGVACA